MDPKEIVVLSPGRINLIGEHIDYNGGHVMPAATDLYIRLKLYNNKNNFSEVQSKTINRSIKLDVNNLKKSKVKWENYVIGSLITIIKKRNANLKNFNCIIDGNLPVGAGISSSSALICGFIKGIGVLNNLDFSDEEILSISRDVEYYFIGVRGGIMDQFSIIHSKENNLIFLNCRSKSFEHINIDLGEYKILLLDTNIKHDLVESSYNDRVRECEEALETVNNQNANYNFLTEFTLEDLETLKSKVSENIYNRALFVIEENDRTLIAKQKLKNSDLKGFGSLMYLSHYGLKNLYEVSCDELDFLVDLTVNNNMILGSRMMGGGFGGCTINIIHSGEVDNFVGDISEKYYKKFSKNLTPIITTLGKGLNYEIIR